MRCARRPWSSALVVGIVVGLGALGCGNEPPHEFHGTRGALDANPSCFTYDGMASITLDDGYYATVGLPPYPNVWGRGGFSLAYGDPTGCHDALGVVGTRVQFGDPVPDPTCEGCGTYRPLFVEGVVFPSQTACSSCDPADCRTFGSTHADQWFLWCDTSLETTP